MGHITEFVIKVGKDWDGVLILLDEVCNRCFSSNQYAIQKNKREWGPEYECICSLCGNRMHILKEVTE